MYFFWSSWPCQGHVRGTWGVTCPTCIFMFLFVNRQKVSRWFSNHRRVFLWILNHQQKVMNVVTFWIFLGRSNVSCVVHKQLFIHCFTLRGLIVFLHQVWSYQPARVLCGKKHVSFCAVGESLACIWANNAMELWTPGFLDVETRGNSY